MRTIETKVYKFDELSESAQERAIEKLWDINVDHEWYEFTFDDAKEIGLKIETFDISYRNNIQGKLLENAYDVAQLITKNHGEQCDTHKLAAKYISNWNALVEKHSDGINKERVSEEHEDEFDEQASDLDNEFERELLEEYLTILRKEYDYLTSAEAIKETIECNEYEFTKDGKLI